MHARAFAAPSLSLILAGGGFLPAAAEARGGWPDIPFVYCYEANAGGDAYVLPVADSTFNVRGCLDGQWRRSDNSDEWDGSSPVPGGLRPDGAAGAPGGAFVETVPGEGDGGGDASVLSMEDVVTADGNYNNRKIFLWRDTSAELDLAAGVTLVARWRLSPEPHSLEFANNGGAEPVPNGTHLHDSRKGQIGFVQKTAVGGTVEATLAFAITDLGHLQFAQDYANTPCAGTFFPAERCVDVDEGDWVTVWMTAQEDPAVPGQTNVKVFLNGATTPEMEFTHVGDFVSAEGAARPEGGGAATSYINIALGATGQTGAIQVDYVCIAPGFQEPSTVNTACPGGLTAALDGRDGVLGWTNGTRIPASVRIIRNGASIAESAPADPPTYRDVGLPPGVYTYELTFNIVGENCPSLQASIDTCPGSLAGTALPGGVRLTWDNPIGADLSLSRDGTAIASLTGDATSYLDTEAPAGLLAYSLVPTEGSCAPTQTTVRYFKAPGAGNFSGITVAWSYCLDPPPSGDPAALLQHNPIANELGDLDGNWSSGNGSDSWDGSAPGVIGDPALDVGGVEAPGTEAPGGIGLVTDGDVGAYLLEDTGDPTAAGWMDPSNRKLYLGNDLGAFVDDAAIRSLINDGITLRARFRVTPPAQAVDVTDAPNGYPTHNNGKSIFSLVHDSGATGSLTLRSQRLGFALDVNPAEPATGLLLIGGATDNVLRVPVSDPTQWLDLWVTTEDPDPLTPEINLNIYLNGANTPTVSVTDFLPQDGGREADIADVGGLPRNPANLLYMGLGATGESGSIEVDLVCVLDGARIPENLPQGVGPFLRGDTDNSNGVNLTDGVRVFNFLFLGGPAPPCLATANTDGRGTPNITSGVYVLNFLFLGGPRPPVPFPVCGRSQDPIDVNLGCITPLASCP